MKGLLWGSYVGSLADPDPVVVWKHQHRTPVASLIPLLTNDVFGLAPQTSILLKYSKEKGNLRRKYLMHLVLEIICGKKIEYYLLYTKSVAVKMTIFIIKTLFVFRIKMVVLTASVSLHNL